jgi:hypothetical protein
MGYFCHELNNATLGHYITKLDCREAFGRRDTSPFDICISQKFPSEIEPSPNKREFPSQITPNAPNSSDLMQVSYRCTVTLPAKRTILLRTAEACYKEKSATK